MCSEMNHKASQSNEDSNSLFLSVFQTSSKERACCDSLESCNVAFYKYFYKHNYQSIVFFLQVKRKAT